MSSWFDGIQEEPLHQYYVLHLVHKSDPFPEKIDLTVGMYRTEEGEYKKSQKQWVAKILLIDFRVSGQPWVLPAVREAEKLILSDPKLDHEYNTTPMVRTSKF